MNLYRRRFSLLAASAALIPGALISTAVSTARAAQADVMQVYKSPLCGCCGAWVDHLRASGFKVRVTDLDDVNPVKVHYGIPPQLASCHTAVIAGYVIEGHVPAEDIMRLLLEGPSARGLAVPGMPIGSPGMEQGDTREPFQVILFGDRGLSVFARHNGA